MQRSLNRMISRRQCFAPFMFFMTGCLLLCLVWCGVAAAESPSGTPGKAPGAKLLQAIASGDSPRPDEHRCPPDIFGEEMDAEGGGQTVHHADYQGTY